jgi:hypothetical protein
MKHATTRELFAYWSRLRALRSAPERSDVDPAAIRSILADTFILEVDQGDRFSIRVVGARVNAIFGRELKGCDFLSLWRKEDRSAGLELIQAVLNDAVPILAGATAAPRGRSRVELELILLPLRHHGRTHARLLGALSPGSIPTWLGLLAADPMMLQSTRVVGLEEGRARRQDARDGAAEPPIERRGRPGAPARRGHLFIHDGGR